MKSINHIKCEAVKSEKWVLSSLFKNQVRNLKANISQSPVFGAPYQELSKNYRYLKGKIKPYKSPRVFVKKGIGRMEFFSLMNSRGIDYVLLRWWENLPEIPEGEDMDILIKDEHRDLIQDLVTFSDNGTGLKCDIYTVSGCNYGSHKGLPYFQSNLAQELLKSRVDFKGAYVPSPMMYFASLSYHAIFHKGYRSGLKGFNKKAEDLEHDYSNILKSQIGKLNLDIEPNVGGLFEWLSENEFAPAEDTLSKLVEINPELAFLQKEIYSDIRGGELIVYVVRDQLCKNDLWSQFIKFLEAKPHFEVIGVRMLTDDEKNICTRQIRGGKWDKGPYKYSGGKPAAYVVVYDYHPTPLLEPEQKKQSRVTDRNNLLAKYEFRELINSCGIRNNNFNGVHSSDNEHDAKFYLSHLDQEFQNTIFNAVELRRKRYARKWPLVKVLSEEKNCRVEIINYKGNLAVQKTFRPGKEKYFRRELLAHKEFSNIENFITPLLEEGDGYIIVPYLENTLEKMSDGEKREALKSKQEDLLGIISSIYKRGMTYIGFNIQNLILTPDKKLFCTNFSYLQYYDNYPTVIDEAYEFTGIPKGFKGDIPEDFNHEKSTFKEVWGEYFPHEKYSTKRIA